jgi:hypothetical protein
MSIPSPYIPTTVANEPTLWWVVGAREITGAMTVRYWHRKESDAVETTGWPGARIWRITQHSETLVWRWSPAGCWVYAEPEAP